MTDHPPAAGLCTTCHANARAPESRRCPACQNGWEHRHANTVALAPTEPEWPPLTDPEVPPCRD
jgi:hypothetical protein